MDYVEVDGLESVTASRKNYDVEVRCMSGVRDRYYDPAIGRYLISDPIGHRAGVNTFGYVFQNPLSNIDTFGLAVVRKNFLGVILRIKCRDLEGCKLKKTTTEVLPDRKPIPNFPRELPPGEFFPALFYPGGGCNARCHYECRSCGSNNVLNINVRAVSCRVIGHVIKI